MTSLSRIFVFAVAAGFLLGSRPANGAAHSEVITSLQAIHALDNERANQSIPVRFEGTVIYYKKGDVDLFIQEGEAAVYVETSSALDLTTGDRVRVEGVTRASFRPEVRGDSVTLLAHGEPPPPLKATFRQLIRAELDCRRVSIRAVVRSANIVIDGGLENIYLQLLMDGGEVDAEVVDSSSGEAAKLLDSDVEITGAVAGKFDNKMELTGILIEIPSLNDVKIVRQAQTVPSALPVTPMDGILGAREVLDRTQRVRVEGTVTYYEPGSVIVLQEGNKSLAVNTLYEKPLTIGDRISASGFPDVENGSLALTRAEVEMSSRHAPIVPLKVGAADLASGRYSFDLVTVEGRLLKTVSESSQDDYVFVSSGRLYTAVIRRPQHGTTGPAPGLSDIAIDSKVRATGVCMLERGERSLNPVAFELMLRSGNDLTVIANPSPLSVRNLIYLSGFLLLVTGLVIARQWRGERRLRGQSAKLAHIEQRRSRILEEINRSRPVAEIVAMILDLMSFKLRGAPCWCELADGEFVGERPADEKGFRILTSPVHSPSGTSLAMLSAALPQGAEPRADEPLALATSAELITLAVETRRLYTDLKHRSEFDQLTDMENRFSLEGRLGQLILESQSTGTVFGLIYIDLDDFKQVNDLFGHKAGDQYLQKVAHRMKHQLRPGDVLARFGGDEFAALIPNVEGVHDVEAVASRLSKCFDQPFILEEDQISGNASFGIAIYPRDGATGDTLISAADAAMYAMKRTRKPQFVSPSAN